MNRFILLGFAVYGSCGSDAIADDYLLRVDTIVYIEKPASQGEAKETILRSIKVIARPESAFHGKVNTGTQTLVVNGTLRPADSGGFHVQIQYVHSSETAITAPTDGRKPAPDISSIQTNVTIAVGDSVTLGGCDITIRESGKPERHSKTRYVMRLAKYTPAED